MDLPGGVHPDRPGVSSRVRVSPDRHPSLAKFRWEGRDGPARRWRAAWKWRKIRRIP